MRKFLHKHTYFVIGASFALALEIDYLNQGQYSHVYLLPVMLAAANFPKVISMPVAVLGALASLLFLPDNYPVPALIAASSRSLMFCITVLIINHAVTGQSKRKDSLIKELTSHLNLNKSLHRLILNDSKTALEVVDQQGKIIYWNEQLAELTGVPNATGHNHKDLFAQSDETGQNIILDTLSTNQEFLDHEITLFPPCKNAVTALVNTHRIQDNTGETLGVLAVYRDITQRKQWEKQVYQAEKFAALGQMAAGLAHEIRNPLTTVKGFLQLISPDNLDPKYDEYRNLMLDEVNRTNKLISNFILLANPSTPVLGKLQLSHLVKEVFDTVKDKAQARNVTLKSNIPPFYTLYIDEEQFRHMLFHLADNALDAMPQGGTLGINADTTFESINIQVWDTGTGIPPESLNRIFDPFFSTKDSSPGLGLSISYHIIKSHHGLIDVQSQPGCGTVFNIHLPLDTVPSDLPLNHQCS